MEKINFSMCNKNRTVGLYDIIDQLGAQTLHTDILNILINFPDNGCFVEIGVFGGGSLLTFHEIINKKHVNFFGIDCWDNNISMNGHISSYYDNLDWKKYIDIQTYCFKTLQNIIDTYNYNISLIKLKNTFDIYDNFENKSIDFLHIDSDHCYEAVYRECEMYYPKMKIGGTMLFDDWECSEVKKAINVFFNEKNIIINSYGNKAWIYVN